MQVKDPNFFPKDGAEPGDAALREETARLYGGLNEAQKMRLHEILSDGSRLRSLLESDAAREIVERLKKGE